MGNICSFVPNTIWYIDPMGSYHKGKLTHECSVEEGQWVFDTFTYRGQFIHAYEWTYLVHGIGKLTYNSGDIYEGDFSHGFINGQGEMIFSDGNIYEGHWVNGACHGQGEMIYSNGDIYEGNWNRGVKHGQGKMIYSNGDIYEGKWNDKYQGDGKLTLKSGTYYDGQWVSGEKMALGN